ncbi:MAG TPA: hypothetical protein EYH06_03735 [Chromatiales bacterium]|nr:hypothetical protein [Thiotrichales bacterium]HIP67683.1 hypothetical protein [Chromatiales bacterium]
MTKKLIKWVIPGLMFAADVGVVAADELHDSIIPQLGIESDAANNSQKDDQNESNDETEEEKKAGAKKTRFGVGYEYRRRHRGERMERPQSPERPQRPDRPGRFGW